MSVVGVSYASSETANVRGQHSTVADGDVHIEMFETAVGRNAWVLYDCDEAEWFAILHNRGAHVTRPGVSMLRDQLPMVYVRYAIRMASRPYFGGVVTRGGYCVVTRSADATQARILNVLPEPHVLTWNTLHVRGGGIQHVTCPNLMYGDTVVSCYPRHMDDAPNETIVVATRKLARRVNGDWTLSALTPRVSVQCARLSATDLLMSVTYVRAVLSGKVFFTVFHTDDASNNTVHGVDLNDGSVTDIQVPGIIHRASLQQSREEVYMKYSVADATNTMSVMGLTNELTYLFTPAVAIGGISTLPGCGILARYDETSDDGSRRRTAIRLISAAGGGGLVIAHTAWYDDDTPPHISGEYAMLSRNQFTFVWFERLMSICLDAAAGTAFILTAQIFRPDMRSPSRAAFKPIRAIGEGARPEALRLITSPSQ